MESPAPSCGSTPAGEPFGRSVALCVGRPLADAEDDELRRVEERDPDFADEPYALSCATFRDVA